MTSPRLTIVIPTVNRAHCVGRAIESALAQDLADIEIIVSDNGSTDGTAEVLARYDDPRLRKYRHATTMPPQEHGNFLLDVARGDFFLGLSDDDYIEPDFARCAINLYARRPELSFIYAACTLHIGDVELPALHGPEVEDGLDFIAAFFGNLRNVCWCACVTRVADLRVIGPIPSDRFLGDMFYWTKIAFRGPVGCIQQPVAHYTFMTADNMSSGIRVIDWAREVQALADESSDRFHAHCRDGVRLGHFDSSVRRFVAISVADQFVWTAIRGAAKGSLATAAWAALPYYWHQAIIWKRIVAALVIPKATLRRLVLWQATRAAAAHERIIRNWRKHLL